MTSNDPARYWRWLAALLVPAVSLHVAVLARETRHGRDGAGLATIRYPDEQNCYMLCANEFVAEGWGFLRDERVLRSPPLPWMWLLAWGRSVVATRFANIGLTLVGAVLISLVARDRYGRRVGLWAFALCAGGYQIVHYGGTVLSEPPAVFFVCLCLWLVHRAILGRRGRYLVLIGVTLGLAALSRTAMQLFPLILVAAWWLADRWRRRGDLPRPTFGLKDAAIVLAVYVAVCAPWVTKNYLTCGVARLANGFGAVMFLGSDLRCDGDEPVFSGMDWQTRQVTGEFTHLQTEGDRRLMRAAKENISRHPWAWAALSLPKAGRTLIGNPNWHCFPADHYQARQRIEGAGPTAVVFAWWTVGGTLVTLFGLAGLFAMFRKVPALAAGCLGLVVYVVGLHAISFAGPRFGLPVYPALVVGCCEFAARRRPRWLSTALVAGSLFVALYLGFYHAYVPRCLVSQGKRDYFTLDKRWEPPAGAADELMLDAEGISPAHNACLFVEVAVEPLPEDGTRSCLLRLRPRGEAAFGEADAISFPLLADGDPHLYQLCVQARPRWREGGWEALSVKVEPPGGSAASIRAVSLGH